MSFEFRAQLAGRDLREDSVTVLVKSAAERRQAKTGFDL
jgi:hypothetical protein